MGVDCQRHAPAALTPRKTRCSLNRMLGGPQGLSGQVQKISPPPGFDPRTVQPAERRYTVRAILLRWIIELILLYHHHHHHFKAQDFSKFRLWFHIFISDDLQVLLYVSINPKFSSKYPCSHSNSKGFPASEGTWQPLPCSTRTRTGSRARITQSRFSCKIHFNIILPYT